MLEISKENLTQGKAIKRERWKYCFGGQCWGLNQQNFHYESPKDFFFFFSFPIVGVPSISDIVYLIPPPNWKYAFTLIVTPTFVLKLNFAQISFATFFLYHMGPNQLYSHADMTICDWSTSYRAKAEKQNFS